MLPGTIGLSPKYIQQLSEGEYFRCPPPTISIFGYVIEDRKIRNTCFFIFPRFHIWGVKTAFKVRVEKIIFVEYLENY